MTTAEPVRKEAYDTLGEPRKFYTWMLYDIERAILGFLAGKCTVVGDDRTRNYHQCGHLETPKPYELTSKSSYLNRQCEVRYLVFSGSYSMAWITIHC